MLDLPYLIINSLRLVPNANKFNNLPIFLPPEHKMLAVHTMNEKFGIEKAKTGKSCLFLTRCRKYHIELENVSYSNRG